MNTSSVKIESNKNKSNSSKNVSIRLLKETKDLIDSITKKVNKKDFGRRLKADDVISKALSAWTEEHKKELQEESLSNADRIERQFKEYCKTHGEISKDEYLGRLLNREIPISESVKTTNDEASRPSSSEKESSFERSFA